MCQIRYIVFWFSNIITFLNCSFLSESDLLCNASCFCSSYSTPCVKHCSLTCRNELLDSSPEPVISEALLSSSNFSNYVCKVAKDFLVFFISIYILSIWLVWIDWLSLSLSLSFFFLLVQCVDGCPFFQQLKNSLFFQNFLSEVSPPLWVKELPYGVVGVRTKLLLFFSR